MVLTSVHDSINDMTPPLNLEPAILTIFGITGDLAQRYLLPAIYQLAHSNLLPDSFRIVGVSRRSISASDVVESIRLSLDKKGITYSSETLEKIGAAISVVSMDITDPAEYARLKQMLDATETEQGRCLYRLYYLAIPATVYGPVVERLGEHDLNHGCQHGNTDSRLLIEKPFGYDLTSAKELIKTLSHSFHEKQIYRIDHYLAKETVQNILTFRMANPFFQTVWNNHHISRITITAAESIGIEGRAFFYEPIGALRDIIQSHLLQIAALITMELPSDLSTAVTHQARRDMLESFQPPRGDVMARETIRAQYDSYAQEAGNLDSQTETFAAVKLGIDHKNWYGVPLFLCTGKKLAHKTTEVVIDFKKSPTSSYTNSLTMHIQPNEGIVLDLHIKRPGFENEIKNTEMNFYYKNVSEERQPEAYERVVVDALRGDQTLFTTSHEVLASWHVIQPILDAWQHNNVPLHTYPAGSAGPSVLNEFFK